MDVFIGEHKTEKLLKLSKKLIQKQFLYLDNRILNQRTY